ncbi:hypothetical protein Tco_0920509 [Tanacetum coccineum]
MGFLGIAKVARAHVGCGVMESDNFVGWLTVNEAGETMNTKRSKAGLVGKRRKPKSRLKLVDEFADESVPILEPRIDDEEDDYQRSVELSLKDLEAKN